jgi:hypothetical protein
MVDEPSSSRSSRSAGVDVISLQATKLRLLYNRAVRAHEEASALERAAWDEAQNLWWAYTKECWAHG